MGSFYTCSYISAQYFSNLAQLLQNVVGGLTHASWYRSACWEDIYNRVICMWTPASLSEASAITTEELAPAMCYPIKHT